MCIRDRVEEEPNIIRQSAPPIRLRNWAIFRPFEMFVRMYGLPDYNEIDPTPLLAVTYALMFGIMFGDAGHGIVLLLGGFLFYKLKKMDLGAIVSCAGFCSILFGLLYGSELCIRDSVRTMYFPPSAKTLLRYPNMWAAPSTKHSFPVLSI